MLTWDTLKKEKFRKQEKENSFISKYCRSLEFNPSNTDKIQMFLSVLHRKKKLYKGKTGTSDAL